MDTEDNDRLKRRSEAKKWADECWDAVEDKEAFVRHINELANPLAPAGAKDPTKMKDHEARLFEKWPMPFGAHKGMQIGLVPLDYLELMASRRMEEESHQFRMKLRRYLRSARARIRKDDDGDLWDEDTSPSDEQEWPEIPDDQCGDPGDERTP